MYFQNMLQRHLQYRAIGGNSSVCRLLPALDLSFMLTKLKNYSTDEYSTVDDDGLSVPPLACAFAKMYQHQHIIGVVDEDGYLVLYNTHKTGKAAVIKTWQVHTNAVFDIEWLESENKLLTGSGDQTIALYDVETCQKVETFKGHGSSIKSISCRVGDDAVFVSGSRDGHIMKWDKRIFHKDGAISPVNTIYNAHLLQKQFATSDKARKKNSSTSIKDAQQSVTAVLFQNENYVISAGAVDGCLKVWDVRKTYKNKGSGAQPVHVFEYAGTNSRKHGYTSLVQDSLGLRLFASCTDDVIYEYDMAAYNPKPIQTWRGHKNSTFYVKSTISPDDQYLISGSSDELAYIWQINKPKASPIVLQGHTAEVTSVAWCPNDLTKIITLSDDTKTKFWRVYCRELQKQSLPQWFGRARRVSKERATSTVNESVTSLPVVSASSPNSHGLSASNKVQLHRASSSPTLSPQGCLRSWLKRKASSQVGDSRNGNKELSITRDSKSSAASPKKPCFDGAHESSASEEPLKSEGSSSCATSSPESSSRSSKRSHDESEGSSSTDSPLFQTPCLKCSREEELYSAPMKKLKPDRCTGTVTASEEFCVRNEPELGQSSQPLPASQSPVKANVQQSLISPRKSKKPVGDVENVPYQSPRKSGKRKPTGDSISPTTSPKRPCLTVIEPNGGGVNKCSVVRASLFSDTVTIKNEKTLASSFSPSKMDVQHIPNTKQNMHEELVEKSGFNSNGEFVNSTIKEIPSHQTTSCEETVKSSESDFVSLEKVQNYSPVEDTDFDSPTRNLPNLVMDQIFGKSLVTPPKSKKGSPKCDWLTQIRLDKKKKTLDSMSKQTISGKSPKFPTGMKKINSYFKTKDGSPS